jgi:hypothetical protein
MGGKQMPAYYAFDYKNGFRDGLIVPSHAYRLLNNWHRTDLRALFAPGTIAVAMQGEDPGAVLMCGTTGDLKSSLKRYVDPSPANLMRFAGFAGDLDGLAAKYVRIKTGGLLSDTVTVICIAGTEGWWHAPDARSAGLAQGWASLRDDFFTGITIKELIPLLKRAKRVAGWVDP